MKVTIAGKPLDLSQLIPMRAGDFRRAEKAGVTLAEIERGTFEGTFQLILAVLKRGDDSITEAALEDLDTDEFKAIGQYLIKNQGKIDRPT